MIDKGLEWAGVQGEVAKGQTWVLFSTLVRSLLEAVKGR